MLPSLKPSTHHEVEAVNPRRMLLIISFYVVLFFSLDLLSGVEGIAFAQAPTTGVKTQSANNYFVDAAIVIVLFGGALFAVCRSSRRN